VWTWVRLVWQELDDGAIISPTSSFAEGKACTMTTGPTNGMITPAYLQRMARYNRWQNENLYGCTERLPDAERKRERGAFFGSIQGTLCHLLVTDQMWLHRFQPDRFEMPAVASIAGTSTAIENWDALKAARVQWDATIISWCDAIDAAWLGGDVSYYSVSMGRDYVRPRGQLLMHLFNHQTHHRGQVHCMLTQAGIKPSDTDLPIMEA
jgi:uncharacterized damage-inducible protein DinB